MHFQVLITLLVSAVQATRVLVPFYLDPSQDVQVPETAWNNIYAAVAGNPGAQFQIILNPSNGPGNSKPGYNNEYIRGVSKMNSYPNVHTFGYVPTGYGKRAAANVKKDIARWASWNTYSAKNISVNGIFFDEVPNYTRKGNTDVAYMADLQAAVTAQLGRAAPSFRTFYNVGTLCQHPEYFNPGMADFVCVFEDAAARFAPATALPARVPARGAAQACVLLVDFVASGLPAARVPAWLRLLADAGVGSANILDYSYDRANSADAPAALGTVAGVLAR